MKKVYIMFSLVVVTTMTNAQVGTTLPLGVFHIDAKNDNPPTGIPNLQQMSNDFIIDDKGQVGVGVIKPEAKLDVKGNLQVQSSFTVGSLPVLTDEDAKALVMNDKGVVGVLDGKVVDPVSFLQTSTNIYNNAASYTTYNNGDFLFVPFKIGDINVNADNLVSISNGDINIMKTGYYQLSLFLNAVIKGQSSSSKAYFKAQILKSSDNGKKWVLVSGVRPIITVTSSSVSYPLYFPNSIIELKKGDLLRVQYARSKDGSGNAQGAVVSEAYLGYNADSGLYPFQFYISKL